MERDPLELALVIVVEEGTPKMTREGTIFRERSLVVAVPQGLRILRSRAGQIRPPAALKIAYVLSNCPVAAEGITTTTSFSLRRTTTSTDSQHDNQHCFSV